MTEEKMSTGAFDLPEVASLMATRFPRRRSTLSVTIDLDPVPGWGNTAEDHRVLVQALLDRSVGHYNPLVEITPAAADPATASKES